MRVTISFCVRGAAREPWMSPAISKHFPLGARIVPRSPSTAEPQAKNFTSPVTGPVDPAVGARANPKALSVERAMPSEA